MSDPVRVLIVDDERLARLGIRRELEGRPEVEVVGECATGGAALEAIRSLRPDLVFLDVRMPGLDGIEVVRRLDPDALPAVVFVTAYDRYAVAAFDVHAVDYVVKPVDPERLGEAYERALRRIREGSLAGLHDRLGLVLERLEEHIAVASGEDSPAATGAEPASSDAPAAAAPPAASAGSRGPGLARPPEFARRPAPPFERVAVEEGGRTFLVEVGEVEWFEAEGNYVRLHLPGRSHLIRRTLKSLQRDLDGGRFLRVHRSAIVNTDRLDYVERGGGEEFAFRLRSGAEVTSSRRYAPGIQRFLREHR